MALPHRLLRSCLTLIMVCGLICVAAGGCGYTQVVGKSRTFNLTLTEYRLIPQSIRVSTGEMTIYVHNYGRLTHNLVISSNGQPTDSVQPIFPGQTAQLSLTLLPGQYSIASTVLSDQALGAYGTLTVTR